MPNRCDIFFKYLLSLEDSIVCENQKIGLLEKEEFVFYYKMDLNVNFKKFLNFLTLIIIEVTQAKHLIIIQSI